MTVIPAFPKNPTVAMPYNISSRINDNRKIYATDLGSLTGNTPWGNSGFSANQILHEIKFGHFEAPKTAILIFWAALNFEFLEFQV